MCHATMSIESAACVRHDGSGLESRAASVPTVEGAPRHGAKSTRASVHAGNETVTHIDPAA
jgi:hypothetical protein